MIYLYIYLTIGLVLAIFMVYEPFLINSGERNSIFEEYGTKKGIYLIFRIGILINLIWLPLLIERVYDNFKTTRVD